jgi:hypothetical protein
MTHVKRVKVTLSLDRISIPLKIEKNKHYISSMSGNAYFATPHPSLAEVQDANNQLETAYNNSLGGSHQAEAILHEKEAVVDNLVTQLGHYVEDTANNQPAIAVSIVLSAGMDVKKDALPVGDVLKPENVKAKFGDIAGQIKLSCKRPKGAKAFVWQQKSGAGNFVPSQGITFPSGVTLSSRFVAIGLTSGTTYTFRVAAIGAANQSDWSDVVVQMAP